MTITGAAIMAALSTLASGAAVTPEARAPIHLVTERVGDGVRLTVIGDAATPTDATYALEVSSGASGGNNNSVQRGTARLIPGEKARLLTLTLGNVADGRWSATLSVDPKPGEPYREQRGSD